MAMAPGTSGDPHEQAVAEINVTPLVDVMLVLLIIFMITAPMLHQGVEVALPRADADPLPVRKDDPLIVSINANGMVYLRDEPIHASRLVERLMPMLRGRSEETVFLKGDRDVPYGKVVELLDLLNRGGITRVGIVTEQAERPASRP